MIKKLIIGAVVMITAIMLTSCNSCTPTTVDQKMEYSYNVVVGSIPQTKTIEAEAVVLPTLTVSINVVDTLAPNVFVLETRVSAAEAVEVAAISLVVDYDPTAITFIDSVTINNVLYHYDLESSLPGITLYNNTGHDLRYSFVSTNPPMIQNEFIFSHIIGLLAPTTIEFSTVPGELEFANLATDIYPLETRSLEFIKVE